MAKKTYTAPNAKIVGKINNVEVTFESRKLLKGDNTVPGVTNWTMEVFNKVYGDKLLTYLVRKLNDDCRAAWILSDENYADMTDKETGFVSYIKAEINEEKTEQVKTAGDLLKALAKIKAEIEAEKDEVKTLDLHAKRLALKAEFLKAKAREEAAEKAALEDI